MNTYEFYFNDLKITHVCKPKLKNTYISVDRNGLVTLKSPYLSDQFIQRLLSEKENWIRKQIQKSLDTPKLQANLEDEVLLFSDIYSIDSDIAKPLRDRLHRLRVYSEKNILRCYDSFYKEYASEFITPRVEEFSKVMNLQFRDLKFKKLKSRWGSCSSHKTLTFNTELIKIDKELIDYVIVHELAHLVYMNHSKNFHDLVARYITDSKTLRKRLKAIHLL